VSGAVAIVSIAAVVAQARRLDPWRRMELIATTGRAALDASDPTEDDYFAVMDVARRVAEEAEVFGAWEEWEVRCLLAACGRVAARVRSAWRLAPEAPAAVVAPTSSAREVVEAREVWATALGEPIAA